MRNKLYKIFYISKTTRLNIEITNHYDAVQYGTVVWMGWDEMQCSFIVLVVKFVKCSSQTPIA